MTRNEIKDRSASAVSRPVRGFCQSRVPAHQQDGQDGYILLAVLVLSAFILIALSVAAPKVAADIQRDREVEMVHRGQQYTRAIKLYYKKFGAYPPSLDALEKSNEIRFLRKRYKDPMTGKDDWHLIHFGENKTPSYGFFGQPIGGAGGSSVAGVGPQGSTGATGMFSNGSNSGSIFGSSGSQSGTQSGISSGTDPSAGGTTGSTDPNASGSSSSGTGSGANSGGGAFSNSGFGSSNNASPLTIGGLGIIGVESTSPKPSILEWKKKKKYNEWEFWYDPNAERQMVSNNTGTVGQPAGGSSGSSLGNGSSTFGSQSNSFGTTTPQNNQSTPTQPTQPQ